MKDRSPAWSIPRSNTYCNARAAYLLVSKRASIPTKVYEFFGGMGQTTRLIRRALPNVPIESWELDAQCLEALRSIPGVRAVEGDSIRDCTPSPGSGVLMDFNLWTLLKARTTYNEVMDRVLGEGPEWVQITDSALGKLHLNYQRYGLANGGWEEYEYGLRRWAEGYGYVLTATERAHSKTVMLLFSQRKTPSAGRR